MWGTRWKLCRQMILFITLSLSGQAWVFIFPGCGCEAGQPAWVTGELDNWETGCLGAWMPGYKTKIEEPNDLVVPGGECDTTDTKDRN